MRESGEMVEERRGRVLRWEVEGESVAEEDIFPNSLSLMQHVIWLNRLKWIHVRKAEAERDATS